MAHDKWRSGTDPIQRWLRIISTVVCLVVFIVLELQGDKEADDLAAISFAFGGLLVLLGYEGIVRIPGISRGDRKDDND